MRGAHVGPDALQIHTNSVDQTLTHLQCEYMDGASLLSEWIFGRSGSALLGCKAPGAGSCPEKWRRGLRGLSAFTLIELMVVVAVAAILAGLTLGGLGFANRKGAASRAQTEVAALTAAIESYKIDFGNYPDSNNLYAELTAQDGATNTNTVYFEPDSDMLTTNAGLRVLLDPYGQPYRYNPTNPVRNVGFFDLWCVPPDAKSEADWIHN